MQGLGFLCSYSSHKQARDIGHPHTTPDLGESQIIYDLPKALRGNSKLDWRESTSGCVGQDIHLLAFTSPNFWYIPLKISLKLGKARDVTQPPTDDPPTPDSQDFSSRSPSDSNKKSGTFCLHC
eukprot:g62992.t1